MPDSDDVRAGVLASLRRFGLAFGVFDFSVTRVPA